MNARAKLYVAFVIALGSLAAIRGCLLWSPQNYLKFGLYLTLAIVGAGLKVRLPRVAGTISVMFVFLLLGIVELSLSETLAMCVAAVITQSYWHAQYTPKLYQVAFSAAVLFMATTAADFVFRSEVFGVVHNSSPLLLAIVSSVFFIVNSVPLAGVFALTENKKFAQIWTETYIWVFPYYLVGAALVGLVGFANGVLNWGTWVLIVPTIYVMYRSYHLYLEKLENQRRRTEEARLHAEQVALLLDQTIAVNEALKRANDDLQQFAYAASHDLHEPLRTMLLYGELLKRRHGPEFSPEAARLLGTVVDSAERVNQLVKDLLSYTRVSGTDRTTDHEADAREVLSEVEQLLIQRITKTNALIEVDELHAVLVHRTHLLQLFQNLVSNSIKYCSPEKQPRIHISSRVVDDLTVQFSFADNGIGIASDYHDRIFGVFKRLHTREVPGTGIGLAICKRVVETYGGNIWVESEQGAGSTFHFTLPAAARTRSTTSIVEAPQSRAAATQKSLRFAAVQNA